MDFWVTCIVIYIFLVIATFYPTLKAIFTKVKLNPGAETFQDSLYFSDAEKERLKQNFNRIEGTLKFWKNQAEKYKMFHYYCLCWTTVVSIIIPVVAQYIDGTNESKLLLTFMSTHLAILLAFYRGFKVDNNYKAFRNGESEFYDTYRRMLDKPKAFGENSEEQINKYFEDVESLRKKIRNLEVDNFPDLRS
jgi:hypothetical protein